MAREYPSKFEWEEIQPRLITQARVEREKKRMTKGPFVARGLQQ